MVTVFDIVRDGFERVHESVPDVVSALSEESLCWRPDDDANPVGWLVWHLSRVQDDHLAGLADRAQVWDDWADRFPLPYDREAIGYGQSSEEVAAFRVSDPGLLTGYHAAVHERTLEILSGLTGDDLDRIVDRAWDPPVTMAARLVSVLDDCTRHIGQAEYVRGLLDRK